MRLAEKRPWSDISLLDIADEAGIPLADLARDFSSRTQVLTELARQVDEAVLRKAERREAGDIARERLFDVVMTRFETMAPYRAALRRIVSEPMLAPELIATFHASLGWMLAAAGIPADGIRGAARRAGLATVYAQTFRVWLEDDDPGLARTMAALDRRLRRGERWLSAAEEVRRTAERLLGSFSLTRRPKPSAKDDAASAPATASGSSGAGPPPDLPPSIH
jgi:AcrR family transcriptional regulator